MTLKTCEIVGEDRPTQARYQPLMVGLLIEDKRVLIAGGGNVALRRALRLLACGAHVTVVAPEATPEIQELSETGSLLWYPRKATPADLAQIEFLVLAMDDATASADLERAARSRKILVNRADTASSGDFLFAAEISDGPLTLAVLTGGAGPFFANFIKTQLLALSKERKWAELGCLLSQFRTEVRSTVEGVKDRRSFLERVRIETLQALMESEGPDSVERYLLGILDSDETSA